MKCDVRRRVGRVQSIRDNAERLTYSMTKRIVTVVGVQLGQLSSFSMLLVHLSFACRQLCICYGDFITLSSPIMSVWRDWQYSLMACRAICEMVIKADIWNRQMCNYSHLRIRIALLTYTDLSCCTEEIYQLCSKSTYVDSHEVYYIRGCRYMQWLPVTLSW